MAAESASTDLARLIDAVMAGSKYRDLDPALVGRVAAVESDKGRSFKETVKATRNKLHQVAGAYVGERVDYAGWLDTLRAAPDATTLHAALRAMLAQHASTRERLPDLDAFYTTILAGCPPIQTLLDLACGLNPLAWPWMPLADGAVYHAVDVYAAQAAFLNAALALGGLEGRAAVWDVLAGPPPVRADVALLLKAIPCLEQVDKGIGRRLLEAVDAPVVIVSYPLRSLGGRGKGMAEGYARHFAELSSGRAWQVTRFEFPTELVYRIRR